MVKIGMIIGDRYEILEKIGTGGMSDVYKARCHKLNRYVAIKVLKQEFSENANFVSKFRVEAQAAAGLMHPNIVNVYDVGEENGIYYIVMELVEGITLKKYIEKKARLSYKEAVSIAIQVSMGIEAAHKNHIIHRDIKPQNIMISKDGKVKVTDFGIAKAATSNTITSNVMGSVHYTSPEQARGGYSDAKSDIYSLGITLFEMLTGRVPFNGETTVAIAIKHIQEEMPSPKEYVPEVPYSVEQIVLKCCQKSPDRRYQNMGELIVDLKQSLIDPEGDFVTQAGYLGAGTRGMSDQEVEQVKRASRQQEKHYGAQEEMMRLRRDEPDYVQEEDEPDEGEDYDYNPKLERVTTILAILAGIAICGIIIYFLVRVFDVFGNDATHQSPGSHILAEEDETPTSGQDEDDSQKEEDPGVQNKAEMTTVPYVIGWTEGDAIAAVRAAGLFYDVEQVENEEYEEGIVFETDLAEGTEVEKGTILKLSVSSGAGQIEVPETAGKTYEDAKTTLEEKGFVVKREEVASDAIASGLVVSQAPQGGTMLEKGSEVVVNVSIGSSEGKVRVPNVIGMTYEDAKKALEDSGFVVATVYEVNNSQIAKGLVCYQSYSQGSYIAPNSFFELHVSLGPGSYGYSGNIEAPSYLEAADYVAGQEVRIVIKASNGQELYNHTTSSFPQAVEFHGIPAESGTVTLSYTVTLQDGTTQDKSFERQITFVEE